MWFFSGNGFYFYFSKFDNIYIIYRNTWWSTDWSFAHLMSWTHINTLDVVFFWYFITNSLCIMFFGLLLLFCADLFSLRLNIVSRRYLLQQFFYCTQAIFSAADFLFSSVCHLGLCLKWEWNALATYITIYFNIQNTAYSHYVKLYIHKKRYTKITKRFFFFSF